MVTVSENRVVLACSLEEVFTEEHYRLNGIGKIFIIVVFSIYFDKIDWLKLFLLTYNFLNKHNRIKIGKNT